MKRKEYIGDGLYAELNTGSVVVTSENGVRVLDTVVIEPHTFQALFAFAVREGFILPDGTLPR